MGYVFTAPNDLMRDAIRERPESAEHYQSSAIYKAATEMTVVALGHVGVLLLNQGYPLASVRDLLIDAIHRTLNDLDLNARADKALKAAALDLLQRQALDPKSLGLAGGLHVEGDG